MAYEVWPDVEKLLHYAIQYGLLDEQDRICAQNQMLDILQLPQPGEATQNCLEGEDDVSAVSYTHLAVYKRQVLVLP